MYLHTYILHTYVNHIPSYTHTSCTYIHTNLHTCIHASFTYIHTYHRVITIHTCSLYIQEHQKAFADIKNYYNDITHNNLDLIKSLKEEVKDLESEERRDQVRIHTYIHTYSTY